VAHHHFVGVVAIGAAATAVINEWVTIGAGIATIGGGFAAIVTLRRRRRQAPKPPRAPSPGASKRDWEIYGARIDQFFEDQKGDNG
jgi:hypothetical protein